MHSNSNLSIGALIAAFFFFGPMAKARLIPIPLELEEQSGSFRIDGNTKFYTNLEGEEKTLFDEYIRTLPAKLPEAGKEEQTNVIRLVVSPLEGFSGNEAYRLAVRPEQVEITANTGAGLFYGIQTLMQWARPDGTLPCVSIADEPRFGYRGFMLDVSRHFFPKEFVLKMLDILSYYKINVFHFHLADTGGWRIESDRYPALTEKTAYRPAENLDDWHGLRNVFCPKDAPDAYGGFYTKEDIREIVRYAAARHITVVPEIDMPGHSRDVLCACPELACDGKDYLTSNELCIGKEETFRFCENVLEELMELFPCPYIHIGGDEANRNNWKDCPHCQKRMEDEGLKNVADLQNYFTNRIEKFLDAHGKTLIGWDEILDGDVSGRAIVMSWREEIDGGGEALRRGHSVIMSPTSHCYLDYYQDIPYMEPPTFGFNSLEKVYRFDPVPASTPNGSLVLGVQGNLWTERIATAEHAEYMAFPRMLAIAEIGWSRPEKMDYPDFRNRALKAVDFLRSKGFHPFDLEHEVGSRPESKKPVAHLAVGKKVSYLAPYNQVDLMGSGETTLTDGALGDWGLYGPRWQGFDGNMDIVVDLDSVREIHEIKASFMQMPHGAIFPPQKVEISISEDGDNYTVLLSKSCGFDPEVKYYIFRHGWKGSAHARYVRLHATRPGWGSMLTDEIIVL